MYTNPPSLTLEGHSDITLFRNPSLLFILSYVYLHLGYNFPTLAAIRPHLEPTASGPSTAWARKTAQRLKCPVAVGYPERTVDQQHIYNALVFVSASGPAVAHTRKAPRFYTD